MSLGFFEDVFVPSYSLQQPAEFLEADKAWRWAIEDGELITSAGDPVRLRVVDVKFSTVPTPAQLKQRGVRLSVNALTLNREGSGGSWVALFSHPPSSSSVVCGFLCLWVGELPLLFVIFSNMSCWRWLV